MTVFIYSNNIYDKLYLYYTQTFFNIYHRPANGQDFWDWRLHRGLDGLDPPNLPIQSPKSCPLAGL